jgi:membrane protein implicated in regulation of membrane protease activity
MQRLNNLLTLGALLLLTAAVALAILNWPALSAAATWQLGFTEVQWPVCAVMLLLAAALFAPPGGGLSEPRHWHDDRNPPHGG